MCVLIILLALTAVSAAAKDYDVESLDNGMRIVLREDHSAPLVAVVICIKAGSAYEDLMTSGSAHFLEHLLFNGTLTRSREQIKQEFESRGGYFNAFTRKDFTAYEIVMPTQYAATGIALQADMLLNSILPEDELKKERQVVIEEIKKDKDSPYYLADQLFAGAFYRETPYAKPIIGYENTIRRMKRSELFSYYERFYHPSNMTAIVVGDFQREEIMRALRESYGPSLARSFETPCRYSELEIMETSKVSHYGPTRSPFVSVGFPAPSFDSPEGPAFELLSHVLVGASNSRLDEALTAGRPPLAAFVMGDYELLTCTTGFTVTFMPLMEHQVDACVDAINAEVLRLAEEPLTQDELARAVFDIKARRMFDEERFLHEARDIAYWEAIASVEKRGQFLEKLSSVTPQAIQQACRTFLIEKNQLVSVLLPRTAFEQAEVERPASHIQKRILENGLRVIAKEIPEAPVSAIHLLVGSRSAIEPEGKEGVGNFVSMMLEAGCTDLSATQIADSLAAMGAELKLTDNPNLPFDDYYDSPDYSYARMEVMSENLERALQLLAQMVSEPTFPDDEVEKTRAQILKLIAKREDSTYRVARGLFFQQLFPNDPYAHEVLGDATSIEGITRDDLKFFHATAYSPANVVVCLVSDKPVDRVLNLAESAFSNLPVAAPLPVTHSSFVKASSPRVTKKQLQKEQAYIYIGFGLPGIASDDTPALEILTSIVSSRLKQELREKQGLAYRVGASVDFHKDVGWFVASIGTRPENIDAAVQGILDELERIRLELPSETELETEKNSYWGHLLRYHQRKINQAYYLCLYEYLGVGFEYDAAHLELLRGVTVEDINRVARRYIDTNGYVLAMSGPVDD
jgi:predicted Zn-dependent peptidase